MPASLRLIPIILFRVFPDIRATRAAGIFSGLIMHMDKPACASNRFYAIPVSPYSTIKRVQHDR